MNFIFQTFLSNSQFILHFSSRFVLVAMNLVVLDNYWSL